MQKVYEEIKRLGGEVLVISFSRPERVAAYVKAHAVPFPALADPSLSAYHAFELGRTSWRDMMELRLLGRFAKMIGQGWLPGLPTQGDDLMQLGGDFVIDRQLRLVFVHPSADPTDRPEPQELVQAVRSAVGSRQ